MYQFNGHLHIVLCEVSAPVHFPIGLSGFFLIDLQALLLYLDLSPLLIICISNIFSLPFHFLNGVPGQTKCLFIIV